MSYLDHTIKINRDFEGAQKDCTKLVFDNNDRYELILKYGSSKEEVVKQLINLIDAMTSEPLPDLSLHDLGDFIREGKVKRKTEDKG